RRRSGWLKQLSHFPAASGIPQVRQDFTGEEIASGAVSVDFAVPTDLALETGADAPFDLRLHHLGTSSLRIAAVDLVKLDKEEASTPALPIPALRPSGRRRVVIIGNCQSETLRQGFAQLDILNR